MNFEVVEYSLPTHWASYFVNGAASGLEDGDIKEADAWCEYTFEGDYHCVSVEDDAGFDPFHDARPEVLPADCSTFVFHVYE